MGWSWAFYLAQHAHSQLITKFSDADPDDFLEMGRPAPSLLSDRPGVHAYCDNLAVFGTDPQKVQAWTDDIVKGLESSGFEVHEREEASTYAATVGVEINGLKGTVSAKPMRLWRLRVTLRWLAERPLVSGQQVERAMGHAVFCLMLNRPLLAIFRDVYDFVRASYRGRSRLWRGAAQECAAAAALLPFACADLRRPLSPLVQCASEDRRGGGAGS